MALFITFEGGEGSGKSLQAEILYKHLCDLKVDSVLTREPGGTPIGDDITHLLKWNSNALSPMTELFLFNASRSQLIDKIIKPALKEGKIIVCDRFDDSTIVYQGYGRGINTSMIKAINRVATDSLKPDLTILLDISPQVSLSRKLGMKQDRFEKEDLDFHQKIRNGYLQLAASEPERWIVFNADQDKNNLSELIWQKVISLMPEIR